MLNIGAGEIAVILVVALLVLGPKRLPELARGIGKFLREFRRHTDEVRTTLETEFYRMDRELMGEEVKPVPQRDEAKTLPPIYGPLDGGRRPADEIPLPPKATTDAPAASGEAPGTTADAGETPAQAGGGGDGTPLPDPATLHLPPARNVMLDAHGVREPEAAAPAVPTPEAATPKGGAS